MRLLLAFFISIFLTQPLVAQIGGESAFEFLTIPNSARSSALGGFSITAMDNDVSLAYDNPNVLNPELNNHLSVSHSFYFSSIQTGNFSYTTQLKDLPVMNFGLKYINYGKFTETDVAGNETGSFKPAEAVVYGSSSYAFDKYAIGGTIKLMYAQFKDLNSFGAGLDAVVSYNDTASRTTASIAFKNIGYQLVAFENTNAQELPFDIQLGVSTRLKYLPFRFHLTAHNLFRWDIRYNDPALSLDDQLIDLDSTQSSKPKRYVSDKIFRHLIFGGEFFLGKNDVFRISASYNHLRRSEMVLETRKGLVGMSFGVGIKVKQFQISYTNANYHVSGNNHQLTLNTNLSKLIKQKN